MASNRTPMSYEVTERLIQMGFQREFATLVGEQMNTDFVARMMLGYLRDGKPTTIWALRSAERSVGVGLSERKWLSLYRRTQKIIRCF